MTSSRHDTFRKLTRTSETSSTGQSEETDRGEAAIGIILSRYPVQTTMEVVRAGHKRDGRRGRRSDEERVRSQRQRGRSKAVCNCSRRRIEGGEISERDEHDRLGGSGRMGEGQAADIESDTDCYFSSGAIKRFTGSHGLQQARRLGATPSSHAYMQKSDNLLRISSQQRRGSSGRTLWM